MLKRILAVARKELMHVWRDKRSFALLFLIPPLMLVLYGYGVNMDVRYNRVGVWDENRSPVSRQLLDKFFHNEYFVNAREIFRQSEINDTLNSKEVGLVIHIPPDFSRDLRAGRPTSVQLLIDGSNSMAAFALIGYSVGPLLELNQEVLSAQPAQPALLELRSQVWFNPELRNDLFVVSGLMGVIMMMMTVFLTAKTLVAERENGNIELLMISPLSSLELVIGKLLPFIGIGSLNYSLVLIAGMLWFHLPFKGSIVAFTLLSLLFLFTLLGIGMLISAVAPSQQLALFIAMLSTMLPSIIFSSFIFPINAMPWILQRLSDLVPAKYFVIALRKILLKGAGLVEIQYEVFVLGLFFLLTVLLSARVFRREMI